MSTEPNTTPSGGKKTSSIEPGQKFGMWTVLSLVEGTSGKTKRYTCRCACGKKKAVLAASLTGGKSRSCGCWIKAAHNKVMGSWFLGSSQRRAEFERKTV